MPVTSPATKTPALARGDHRSGKRFAGIGHDGVTVYGDLESRVALNALLESL